MGNKISRPSGYISFAEDCDDHASDFYPANRGRLSHILNNKPVEHIETNFIVTLHTSVMRQMIKKVNPTVILLFFMVLTSIQGCRKDEVFFYNGPGKKPVYATLEETRIIQNLPEQPVVATGGIFLMEPLFFMAEQRKGIHVYDVTDPALPVYLTFISIPAIGDFTISDKRLYADSWRDLVTLDISDIMNVKVIDRVENVFTPLFYPVNYQGSFECIDETKGVVVGWKDAILKDARCFTNN